MKKMLTFCILVAMMVSMSGCGKFDRLFSSVTGQPSKVCVDGVSYLQFTSGATVQVDQTGKPVVCGK